MFLESYTWLSVVSAIPVFLTYPFMTRRDAKETLHFVGLRVVVHRLFGAAVTLHGLICALGFWYLRPSSPYNTVLTILMVYGGFQAVTGITVMIGHSEW